MGLRENKYLKSDFVDWDFILLSGYKSDVLWLS
jgi:hypothetical protein